MTGSNLHRLDGLALPDGRRRARRATGCPAGRAAGAAAYALGRALPRASSEHLRGAAIVHAAEIGTWFSAQAARLKREARLPARADGVGDDPVARRLPLAARAPLPRARSCRPPTCSWPRPSARATRCCSRACRAERIAVSPPGRGPRALRRGAGAPPGRQHARCRRGGWCGRRATRTCCAPLAALRRGHRRPARGPTSRLLVVGDGPEAGGCARYAAELGVGGAVEFRADRALRRDARRSTRARLVPRARLAAARAAGRSSSAWCSSRRWRPGTPVVAARLGRDPRGARRHGALVRPGDWKAMAQALRDGPLGGARPAAGPGACSPASRPTGPRAGRRDALPLARRLSARWRRPPPRPSRPATTTSSGRTSSPSSRARSGARWTSAAAAAASGCR